VVRAGAAIEYPEKTVAVSSVFPDFEQYQGPPFEFGKMITSASDPAVQLQYGLRVGIREAEQLDALETLKIRGEHSITCKATSTAHHRLASCLPVCLQPARSSASNPMHWSAQLNWIRSMGAIRTWRKCPCIAQCSH
jgi:hypothetical protein